MRFACSSFKSYFLNIRFACANQSRNLNKFRVISRNKMRLKTLESRNLMPFFIVAYLKRENKIPRITVSPNWRNYKAPAKLSTNQAIFFAASYTLPYYIS